MRRRPLWTQFAALVATTSLPAVRSVPRWIGSALGSAFGSGHGGCRLASVGPGGGGQTGLLGSRRRIRKIIEGWGRFTTEIAPRASPILLLLRDAARTDPDLHVLLEEMDSDRLRRMTDNARRLHAAGHLRSGITVAVAADVMWTYSSPELYELLVLRRGMPLKRYGQFVTQAMIAALL